ncbi:hypothetical protein ABT187_43185, partial [Streptomyces sp. NPDC001817]
MNTDELEAVTYVAERRVLEIQAKLHRWARDDPHRRFDDLFNLVADPAFLLVAWDRVRGNKGAKTAGVDGRTAASIVARTGVEEFLGGLRDSIKDRSFRPLPVRERMIPKVGGKLRRLGIGMAASYCPSCCDGSGFRGEVPGFGDAPQAGGLSLVVPEDTPASAGSLAGGQLVVGDPVVDRVGRDPQAAGHLLDRDLAVQERDRERGGDLVDVADPADRRRI